jgi:hypothetical protein
MSPAKKNSGATEPPPLTADRSMSDQVKEWEPQVPGPHFARRMAARIYVAAFLAAFGTTFFGWLIFLGWGVYRLFLS